MTLTHTHDFKPCAPGAFRGGLTRTLFFDGMVLSEADMMREQSYWRMKRKLTNRALGHGVVWGLAVEWDAKSRCFTVCPGYALSCCGEDLIVECPTVVCENQLIDVCSEDFRELLKDYAEQGHKVRPDHPIEACLFLEYVECPEDPRRVYEDPCAETAKGCRFGAVRETVRLRLLPPPPPEPAGPIERFCKSLELLRTELNIPVPVVAPGPAVKAKIGVTHFGATGNSIGGQTADLEIAPAPAASATATKSIGQDVPKNVRVSVEPPPGYVFTAVAIDGTAQTGLQTLMDVSYDLPNTPGNATRNIDVEIVPLFGTDPGWRVSIALATQFTAAETKVTATLGVPEALATRTDCGSLFTRPWIFSADPECTLKALVLAALYGWFAGALAPADCTNALEIRQRADMDKGRAGLAWVITWIAWKALYGFDIANTDQAKVQNGLRRLFTEWCCGFHYKGPRCTSNAHGVYLGCVEVTPRGKIICFHEWEHRRYVLTGPLLTHWGSQLGLAPIDVVANRFAEWICCVSQARVPTPAQTDIPTGAMMMSLGAGFLAFGNTMAGSPLAGATMGTPRKVSLLGMAFEALRVMASDRASSFATAAQVEVVQAEGTELRLLIPRALSIAQPFGIRQAVGAEFGDILRTAPHMSREAITDLVSEVAAATPVSGLKLEGDPAAFETVASALEKEGVVTLSDLLTLSPELAAERVRATAAPGSPLADKLSADKALAPIYAKAVAALSSVGEAVAKDASARDAADPFTRADLKDTVVDVQKAVAPHLEKNTLTRPMLAAAAAKAIAART